LACLGGGNVIPIIALEALDAPFAEIRCVAVPVQQTVRNVGTPRPLNSPGAHVRVFLYFHLDGIL
jgi:hypothetical protein